MPYPDTASEPPDRLSTASLHPQLRILFEALNEAGLTWLLLRGEDELAKPAGDVDLLVAVGDLLGFGRVASKAGFHRIFAPGRGSHRFYYGLDTQAREWLKLDVVADIAFGRYQELSTPLAEGCLSRRVPGRAEPVWLPAPADRSWLLLAHLVFDKGRLAPARVEARTAAAPTGAAVPQFLDTVLGSGTAQTIKHTLKEQPSRIRDLSSTLTARWTRQARARVWSARLTNRLAQTISPTIDRPGPFANGLQVAVMGPDGAGKTTLLRALSKALPLPAKYVYLGMWSASPWDPYLRGIPGGRICQKLVRLIRARVTSSYHLHRGRVVLLDRVAYDAELPGARDNSIGGRISAALIRTLSPRPDLVLLLDAPGELMYARKSEHSVAELEAWRHAYRTLAASLPNCRLIDATQDADQVLRIAQNLVWATLTTKDHRVKPTRPTPSVASA